ncbi:Kelch domain-containing protein 1 [Takifugu flavidus]|uniref:Kelch domain-containing protein 1 n=1 Tax=Takifugu flavidus TaxID=433684 RepID=A0A5C6NYT6_9TELE|nr:Kelch domain-containing protein 1 [Takifugu flavidus]
MDSGFQRHISELVARERSGHTAVVEGSLLYVWGGYMSVADDEVFLPNNEIWVYDLEGDVPPSMSGACGCSLDGHMYIFGGCDDNGQTNMIYCVNLTDGKYTWRRIGQGLGSAPSPRDKLSCWVYKRSLVYFGGYGHKLLTDVDSRNRSFIVDEASWGRAPAPRAAHASATLGHRGYICGGRVMETRTSDVHCLDLDAWTWTEMYIVLNTQSWHTLTAVSDTSLFLFGGLSVDCKPMSDGWLLDVETKLWREVEHPFNNKPRLWHTACQGNDADVIVFGGSCDYILLVDTGHCNDALVFQTQPYPLFRICEDYIAKNVKNYEALRNQLPRLPSKLLTAVQKRMSFYRPSKKQR